MALKTVEIPASADGMKAEAFIRRMLPNLTESALRKLFDKKDVKLDDKRIDRNSPLKAGQTLKLYIQTEEQTLDIVYEDDTVLLVNKRPGISVEPDKNGGITLTDLCAQHVRKENPDVFPPRACHRLDHRTCGLCLFAKTEEATEILQNVFKERTLRKEYTCLVRGMMKPPQATCKAWLLKDHEQAKVTILDHKAPGAKEIITAYETLEAGPISRLKVHLITGRTHQIRAHLAALGHPVLGDDLYGDRDFNKANKARTLKLCATDLQLDTKGKIPGLDNREFHIDPPF